MSQNSNKHKNSARKMVASGVEWIGEMPSAWRASQLKDLSAIQVGKTPDTSRAENFDGGLPWITISDLREDGVFPKETSRTISSVGVAACGIKQAKKGSVLVSFKLSVGKVALAEEGVYTNEAISALIPKDGVSADYLFWAAPLGFIGSATENIYGTKILNQEGLQAVKIPHPPLLEQRAIASYLDHHVSLIDRERELISQKIDLLKDKRRAMIYEVVTGKRVLVEREALAGRDDWSDVIGSGPVVAIPAPRADDPFAQKGRLVDSGVEWIGDIPQGWTTSRIGVEFSVEAGIPAPPTAEPMSNGLIPFVRTSDLAKNPGLALRETRDGIQGPARTYPKGTIVFPKSGESIRTGVRKILIGGQAVVSHLACLVPQHDTGFGIWVMEVVDFEEETNQTSLPSLNLDVISRKQIPWAPLPEQRVIASFLSRETSLIDQEIDLLTRKHSLLGEQRKALIFEAVTGKLDVSA